MSKNRPTNLKFVGRFLSKKHKNNSNKTIKTFKSNKIAEKIAKKLEKSDEKG